MSSELAAGRQGGARRRPDRPRRMGSQAPSPRRRSAGPPSAHARWSGRAVKVQYRAWARRSADLDNAGPSSPPSHDVPGLDPSRWWRSCGRFVEELDYRLELTTSGLFADFTGYPFIHIPRSSGSCHGARATTELARACGSRWRSAGARRSADLAARDDLPVRVRQPVHGSTPSTATRTRQLPVPAGGQVTFLDFGLVKRFTKPRSTCSSG